MLLFKIYSVSRKYRGSVDMSKMSKKGYKCNIRMCFMMSIGSTLNVQVSNTKIQFSLRGTCLVPYVETKAR